MDAVPISIAPSGFYGWLLQYGGILQLFVQLAYWIGMLVLVFYAVFQFKRWVNYQLGTGQSGKLRPDLAEPSAQRSAPAPVGPPVKEPESQVPVEKFVE